MGSDQVSPRTDLELPKREESYKRHLLARETRRNLTHSSLIPQFLFMVSFKSFSLILSLAPAVLAASVPRLDMSKAAVLVIDHQVGLIQLVQDISPAEYRNNIIAHAELGVVFGLPTILSTSAENGSLPCDMVGPLFLTNTCL
jgi:hypothetical protein